MARPLYEQLPLGKRSIRLLNIFPSLSASSPIKCTLYVASLPGDTSEPWPEYKAFSYAWRDTTPLLNAPGSEFRGAVISCNESDVNIPTNLFAALVRLRQKNDVSVTLWVDYLCINQSDTNERNEQVELMHEIFSRSSEVLIWLGEPPKTQLATASSQQYHWEGDNRDNFLINAYQGSFNKLAGAAVGLLPLQDREDRFWGGAGHAYGAFCLLSLLSQRVPASQISFYDPSVETRAKRSWARSLRKSISDITDRAWWKRTWVVQECVLAKNATVYYGHLSARWDMFSQAATFYMGDRPSHNLSRITRNARTDSVGLNDAVSRETEDPLAKLSGLVLQIEIPRMALSQGQFLSPLETLRRFHGREATDPRDKVFGLLGLLSDPFLSPDYRMSRDDVNLTAAMRIIISTKSLELLPGANLSAHTGTRSWYPDWGSPPKENEWQRLQCRNLYNASRGIPAPTLGIHRMPTNAILEVHGIWLERVRYVTRSLAPDDGFRNFQAAEERWRDAIRRKLGFSGTLFHGGGSWPLRDDDLPDDNLPDYLWTSEGYAEAFWRALCGDVIYTGGSQADEGNYRRATLEDYKSYQALIEDEKGLMRSRSTAKGDRLFNYVQPNFATWARNHFFYAMQTMTAGRCMFVTESRRIGIGPPGISTGDRVALLSGSTVPFLLRNSKSVVCNGGLVERLLPQVTQMGTGGGRFCKSVHECYIVVGDAYVSGIMDGEAVENNIRKIEKIYLI